MRRYFILVVAGVALLLACTLVPGTRFSSVETEICSRCGARQVRTRWVTGRVGTARLETSALSEWLAARGVAHEHEWQFQHATGRNVFGKGISAASTAGTCPVQSIAPTRLAEFLRTGSETDLGELARVMTTGTEEDQTRVIEKYGLAQ